MTEFVESGDFAVDAEARTVRGLLLPWGETSRLSVSDTPPISFPRGSVPVPEDPSYMSVNVGHDRYQPVGRVTAVEDSDAGLVAQFSIAKTPEGDQFLDDHREGRIRKLSAELTDIVRAGAQGVKARLTGAAFVTEGAFASAALFAIGEVAEAEPEPTPEPEQPEAQTTDNADAESDTKPDEPAQTEEKPVGIPNTMDASAKQTPNRGIGKNAMLALLNGAQRGQLNPEQRSLLAAEIGHTPDNKGLFALSDIVFDGTNGTGPVNTMVVPQWLGELYSDATKPYIETWSNLFGSPASLTSLRLQGWRYTQALQGDTWSGNKTAIPSGSVAVEPVTGDASRFAGGADVAREYIDFGLDGFFDDLFTQLARSYTVWKDQYIVGPQVLAATSQMEADNPAGLAVGEALSKIIDGAVEVYRRSQTIPTFAVVGLDDYKTILKTPATDVLGYLNAALGLTGGELAGFQIKPSTLVTNDSVVVGSSIAATIYELGGDAPIRVSAPNIAQGGLDISVFGYAGCLVTRPEALIEVLPYGTAPESGRGI